jgi:hypothetical protein
MDITRTCSELAESSRSALHSVLLALLASLTPQSAHAGAPLADILTATRGERGRAVRQLAGVCLVSG